jgi:hypothetical protein
VDSGYRIIPILTGTALCTVYKEGYMGEATPSVPRPSRPETSLMFPVLAASRPCKCAC